MKWFLIIWIASSQWPIGEARWMDNIVTSSEADCRTYIDTQSEREYIVVAAKEQRTIVLDLDCMPEWWFEHHAPTTISLRPGKIS